MRRPSRLPTLVTGVAMVAALLIGVSSVPAEPAAAADGRQFNAGNIISDETFFNSASMSVDSIQAFLNAQVVTCRGTGGQPCLKDYAQTTTSRAGDAYCSAIDGRANESAASIVQRVGSVCGINPQVLLVMLQKEQGLVQSVAPTATAYKIAMGYGCPDTAPCDTAYYGFFNQVWNAAHQFQRYTKTSSSWSYQPRRTNNVFYHPNAACGTKSVYIENQATANLYLYTPYTPNAAALNAGYGTGDSCSAYGNRNFYLYFTDWFGNPSNWLQSASFEGGSVAGWNWSNGPINRLAVADRRAADGNWFLAANTSAAGRAVTQDVARPTRVGEQATVTVQLRSEGTKPFSGKVVVWGLGGATEHAEQPFTVGPQWTPITVKLPVEDSDHSTVRLDVYMTSTDTTLWMDGTSMTFGAAPVKHNRLSHPSFEGSFANWVPGYGFVNQQIYDQPSLSRDGNWFAASNTPVAGRSFAQYTDVTHVSGDRWTLSMWLRSANGAPFSGRLALWSFGSSDRVAVVPYTVNGQWTQVSVTVDVGDTNVRSLKSELYMDTAGSTVWLDDASLTRNVLPNGSFEGPSAVGWTRSADAVNFAVYGRGQGTPGHGDAFAATNTGAPGTSVWSAASLTPTIGDDYTAEVLVRSGSAQPFTGRLALWALGGTSEVAVVPFTSTSAWTTVRVPLTIARDGHTSLRLEIYEDSPGSTLFLDGAQLR